MNVCFDIGGTSIKGALVKTPSVIDLVPRIATPGCDLDAFIAALDSVVKQAGEKPKCVSISITGIINPTNGLAVVANVPCLHGRPMQRDLEEALGLPVIITNDADCFTLAEAELGVAKGHDVVFGVILGTGVGGGIVVDGQLLNRRGGFAGEWGHGPVAATEAGNPPVQLPRFSCGCGLDGCIDAICSARGMEKLHKHLHAETAQAEDILTRWLAGEKQSSRTIEIYVDLIASPLALVVNTVGASIIPVGGGLSNVPKLIARIDKAVRERVLMPPEAPLVVPAENKIEPGIIGAAVLGNRAFP